MTTFIIVRHAQSVANLQKVFAGHYDIDLSELGYMQAEKAAAYIQEHYPVDKVYASDLKRTCQTAQPIAKLCNAELVTTPALREIFAGEWEGVSFEQLQKDYEKDYTKYCYYSLPSGFGCCGCVYCPPLPRKTNSPSQTRIPS